jgi:hypothetical protein
MGRGRLPRAMPSRVRKSMLSALFAAALFTVAGCGESHTKVTTGTYAGESGANAPYLNVGPLAYEVQQSRQLSPFDTEDAAYLRGLSPLQGAITREQEWFAVFLQVYNRSSSSHQAASSFTIRDTQGNVYKPLVPEQANSFVYRAEAVPAKGRLPAPDSVAASGPTQGAVLLYKIQINSLNNRPLKLTIVDPSDPAQTATAELDV